MHNPPPFPFTLVLDCIKVHLSVLIKWPIHTHILASSSTCCVPIYTMIHYILYEKKIILYLKNVYDWM